MAKLNTELFRNHLLSLPDNKFWELYRFVNLLARKKLEERLTNIKKEADFGSFDFWSDEEINYMGKLGYNSRFFR